MEVTVKFNGKKAKAKVQFAQPDDFGFAKTWRDAVGADQNPVRNDSVEFAELAIKKYEAAFLSGTYANSMGDFRDHIESNPKVEVGGFIVMRCDWYPGAEVIGFAHFRRTWCNKIVLDYLGTHPLIARPLEGAIHNVKSVGVGLLYFIGQVLKNENCLALWGEATSSSASYYKKIFGLPAVEDLIYAPRENVLVLMAECERDWAAGNEVNPAASKLLNEIADLEVDNPPFIGSKAVVFNQSKRLAFRYLRLPYHSQIDVAQALNVPSVEDCSKEGLAQIVFNHARQTGRLSELWDLVEKKHGDGNTDKNPFEPIKTPGK